jgi:putative SOS response-associated peptidase YedK
MCGRITLTTPDVSDVARMLEAHVSPEDAALYRPRFNAAPTDRHWVVGLASDVRPIKIDGIPSTHRVLVPAVWGFGNGAINARSESVETLFRKSFAERRVVVPADGFYEWTGPRNARRPIWFRPREGGLLYLAGLAETLPDGRLGFVVLTTDAAGAVAPVHDRMPALLTRETVQRWLEHPDSGLLVPTDTLFGTEVSSRVNDVHNDDPSLLGPPEQLSLL